LLRDHLPPGVGLRDLGERRLRDVIQPEHIFQVTAADLPSEFPPVKLATIDEQNRDTTNSWGLSDRSRSGPLVGRSDLMQRMTDRLVRGHPGEVSRRP